MADSATVCRHAYVSGLQPLVFLGSSTWAFGPGWYGAGLWPLL